MKKIIALLPVMLAFLVSCGEKEESPVVLQYIYVEPSTLSLVEGEQKQLELRYTPEDAVDKSVVWSCSDPSVAQVTEDGTVTALKRGSATVTVTSTNGMAEASCAVTVIQNTSSYEDLSADGIANCYMVFSSGKYKFQATMGSFGMLSGNVSGVKVLWESFGTDETPSVGALVSDVTYMNGHVFFSASSRKGNALIAAEDPDGNILWSWHIWMTDRPEDQIYNNGAGTMMDRNLGASSVIPGDPCALGLMYQWGRKDPFPGSSRIDSAAPAATTITWPDAVGSTPQTGTVGYAISHPTTFIAANTNNYDWFYQDNPITDDARWESSKTMYDPCPAGYRIPDGGDDGTWSTAFDNIEGVVMSSDWSADSKGINFGQASMRLGSASTIWYPGAGYLNCDNGILESTGIEGDYWTCTPYACVMHVLFINAVGSVIPTRTAYRADGLSVRCLKQ